MPFAMQQQLQQHVLQPALTAQRLPIQPVFCESFVDGIDVRYRVTLDGVESVLNSCGTDVVADSALWQALSNIWTYFERNS